ncbi:MAG: hypothetical protein NZ899_05650 [Thermoguttaceae bacterium]|nr:hypothetical protein [Thermoguttaceae bacterium]MDW8079425.1 hypothetical protein [Thermoguttaceae bacterium]
MPSWLHLGCVRRLSTQRQMTLAEDNISCISPPEAPRELDPHRTG